MIMTPGQAVQIARKGLAELPLPSPDQQFYDAVRSEGFRRFPKRLENFDRFKSSERNKTCDYLPIKLDIENVSRCNYRCTMCQVSEWPKMTRAADMSFEDFKTLIDEQYGLIEIKLQGMGEPALGGDSYYEMIGEARRRSIWVRSTTNASLLHLNDNIKKFVASDICELQVSIDGATKETYEAIRLGGRFEKVVENCSALNQHAEDVGRLRTRMWTVLQNENLGELELFPELAAKMGFNRLTLSLDLADWGQEHWQNHNDEIDCHQDFSVERGLNLVRMGEALGVEVTFWHVDEKYSTTSPDRLCPWPFERGFVSSDMRIVPCCMIANPDVCDLGDAKSFASEWNGESIANFRDLHLSGNIPKVCASCYSAPKAGRDTA